MNTAAKIRLDAELRGALPAVVGSSVYTVDPDHSKWSGPTSWRAKGGDTIRIDWANEASRLVGEAQAFVIVDAFDPSPAADQAAEEAAHPERTILRNSATAAVDMLDQYLTDADTGTAAQIQARDHAQVKRLSQMMRKVIIRLVQVD